MAHDTVRRLDVELLADVADRRGVAAIFDAPADEVVDLPLFRGECYVRHWGPPFRYGEDSGCRLKGTRECRRPRPGEHPYMTDVLEYIVLPYTNKEKK